MHTEQSDAGLLTRIGRMINYEIQRRAKFVAGQPPDPADDVGDPRAFLPWEGEFDGGAFGRWILDRAQLPAYEYTMDQYSDLRARYPNSLHRDLRSHWHQIGNDRVTGLASNDGYVQVYVSERSPMLLNYFEADSRTNLLGLTLAVGEILATAPLRWLQTRNLTEAQRRHRTPGTGTLLKNAFSVPRAHRSHATANAYGGGFGYVDDGTKTWATAYRYCPSGADTRRVFGMGYYHTVTSYRNVEVARYVYAPAGDLRGLLSDVTLTNTGEQAVTLRYYEYWDVNVHQLELQWLRTGVFGPVGDAARRSINRKFTASIRWQDAHKTLRFQQMPPSDAPGPAVPSDFDWYPPDIFLAAVGQAPDAYYFGEEDFFGTGDASAPDAVRQRRDPGAITRIDAHMPYCMVLRYDLTIPPGESVSLRFAYGAVERGEPLDFIQQYAEGNPLATMQENWKDRLAYFTIGSAPELQREIAWHAYSLLSSTLTNQFYQTRVVPQGSAYLYLHGADGAPRDQALFTLPLTYLDPTLARDTLRLIMRLTYAETHNITYAFAGHGMLSGAGIHENPSDLDLFFLLALTEYLAATGDMQFLEEVVPFYPPDTPATTPPTLSVIEHACTAVNHLLDKFWPDDHSLLRISDGDWSDGVVVESALTQFLRVSYENTVKHGTSVPNTQMALYVLPRAANLLESHDPELAKRIRDILPGLKSALDTVWAGRWYARAVLRDHQNRPLPLHADKIDLEAQPWALISGCAAEADHEETLVAAIDELLDEPSPIGAPLQQKGMIWPAVSQLLTWGYTRRHPDLAWRSLYRHTFAQKATTFPNVWFGIWSGPDGLNGRGTSSPGGTWASPLTPMTDFPVMNNNPHAMMLLALLRVCGIEPTESGDGLIIAPGKPERFALYMPLLRLEAGPGRIAGTYTGHVDGERTLYVRVPEDAQELVATVGGKKRKAALKDGLVPLKLAFTAGKPIEFTVTWA